MKLQGICELILSVICKIEGGGKVEGEQKPTVTNELQCGYFKDNRGSHT